jgi:hypothetical protein
MYLSIRTRVRATSPTIMCDDQVKNQGNRPHIVSQSLLLFIIRVKREKWQSGTNRFTVFFLPTNDRFFFLDGLKNGVPSAQLLCVILLPQKETVNTVSSGVNGGEIRRFWKQAATSCICEPSQHLLAPCAVHIRSGTAASKVAVSPPLPAPGGPGSERAQEYRLR